MNDFLKAIQGDVADEPKFESPMPGFSQQLPYERIKPNDPNNPTKKTISSYPYDFQHKVYLIFRPWSDCPVCRGLFQNSQLPAVENGHYECPHNNHADYMELNRKFLHEGYVPVSRKEEILKSGAVIISVSWLIPHKKQVNRAAPPRL